MLSSKYGDKFRTELSDDIKGHINDLKKLNDEKRAAKLLQTPLVLCCSIFVCWIAISIFGKFFQMLLKKVFLAITNKNLVAFSSVRHFESNYLLYLNFKHSI